MILATPPRFGTMPLEEDDMFALRPQLCADCKKTFETSRSSDRCALCSATRAGVVGPATVLCPVCGVEHQVAILSPSKLCEVCKTDLVIAESNVRVDLENAESAYAAALIEMERAATAATADEVARYAKACEARAARLLHVEARWAKTITQGGALAALLVTHDAREVARQALDAARQVLREVEAAR